MQRYCQITNCIFQKSHSTIGHQCSKCNGYGHGYRECGKSNLITDLTRFHLDILPESEQCNVESCLHKNTHNRTAHTCRKCNKHGHGYTECNLYSIPPLFAYTEALEKMSYITGKIYYSIWTNMGTTTYYKRNSPGENLQQFVTDTGVDTKRELDHFLVGYQRIK